MDREINILNYLPQILKEVKELKAIADSENPELQSLWTSIANALSDQFVNDATEYGVSRLEKILKIVAKGTDSLDDRKFRILTRLNEQLPHTYRTLQNQLANLCGEDGYTLTLNHSQYTMTVRVALTAKSNFNDVDALLQRVTPANIVIDLSLMYNQHQTLAQLTHQQLSAYTHDQLRNEVIA